MEPPQPPDESECCGSGCDPCIFDVYEQQLQRYTKNVIIPAYDTKNCLSLASYAIFELIKIELESNNTCLYTFKYKRRNIGAEPDIKLDLGILPGQHLLLRGGVLDAYFTRAYTPLTINNIDLSFTVLIKLYEEGKMSDYVRNLHINSETYWRGPYGGFMINYGLKYMFMICQGTGVAPIYAIISKIVENVECCTFLKLFYCCSDYNTIHLRNQIYELSKYWNFTYEIFLSRNSGSFQQKYNEKINLRKLSVTDIENYLKSISCDLNLHILVCGSVEFNQIMLEYVKSCGIDENTVHLF